MTIDADKKQTLTVSTIRNVNVVNIMQSILRDRTKTRSELAKENHISVMTVKHIVDDLIAGGILVEKVCGGSDVGRKPKALEINEKFGNIVCINLTSVDEINFLIYDIYEAPEAEQTLEFDQKCTYRENLLRAVGLIKEKLAALHTVTVGIAVFVPSAYYENVDLVNYDLIADFKDLHIKQLFAEAFGIGNILVLHDVVPAAWSEYESMDSESDSQFYFYCGHGVGGFFIHRGTAVMGQELMAGEVGKMLLLTDSAGKKYTTFEDMISVSVLNQKLREAGIDKKFKEVIRTYEEQGEEAKRVVDEALDVIVRVLYNLLWVYNPGTLVVDSCYSDYSRLIMTRFQEFVESLENEAIPIHVEVRQALYDEYHMMRGCFHMVRDAWVDEIYN
ncbi:ROK family protein [Blautia marasmi]|uniref:ROK family protein n=1 Tax=Blautia marasmi TaxID=1917868 RepID=UPI00266CDBD0|nr:ROK family protein [Blautia marasmi]